MPATAIEIMTIGAYLAVMVAVGLVMRRFNRNVSDYFRNGCQGTWWLVGSSAFMSSFSAWTFTGAAGVAFESGWTVSIIFLGNALGFFLNFLFLAAWFRQLRAITVPEIIRARFGPITQQAYAWFSVPTAVLYASLQLYGLALFTSAVFNLELQAVIIGVGVVVLIYSVIGGSWAVMSADFLQTIILLPLTVLMAFLCLKEVGGIGGFLSMIHERGLADDFAMIQESGRYPLNEYTWVWAAAMFLQIGFSSNSMISASRYFSVKDGREARKAALLGGVLMLLGTLIWFIPPMTARLLYETQVNGVPIDKPAEAAYAIASQRLLPTGMAGLMVVAMFAATMSSMDAGLNRCAAVFTQDIYPPLSRIARRNLFTGKKLLLLGQGFSLMLGVLIILLAVYFSRVQGYGIFKLMLNIGAMLGIPLATPMFLSLFIRKAPGWSALFSVGCGLVPSFMSGVAAQEWSFQDKVFINTGAGVAGFLLTMPFWAMSTQAYRDRVARFFKTMHTPVDFAREVGVDTDLSQLKIIGVFAMVIGGLIGLLALAPNPLSGRLEILSVAGSVALIGLLLAWCGWTSANPKHATHRNRDTPASSTGEITVDSGQP